MECSSSSDTSESSENESIDADVLQISGRIVSNTLSDESENSENDSMDADIEVDRIRANTISGLTIYIEMFLCISKKSAKIIKPHRMEFIIITCKLLH